MFATHQPKIGRWARRNEENLTDVVLFAILSARQPFAAVRGQFEAVHNADWSPLFSWKRKAWIEQQDYSVERYQKLMQLWYMNTGGAITLEQFTIEALEEVSTWHGLSLVKGSFVLQMAFGVSACIDSRNEAMYEVSTRKFRMDKSTKLEKRRQLIKSYLSFCNELGGCRKIWDAWCNHYGETSDAFVDGEDVSAEHCRILGIDPSTQRGYVHDWTYKG